MAWTNDVPVSTRLKQTLEEFIEGKIELQQYKSRLPKAFYSIASAMPGKKTAGIGVAIMTEADEQAPHIYSDETGPIREEFHRIAIDVKGDAKSGGVDAGDAMGDVLKSLFSDPTCIAELIALGITNVRQSNEAMDFGANTEFQRPLFLTCSTDTYL